LLRLYGILALLIQQFSIVLCYQPEFYDRCVEALSDSMSGAAEEPAIRSTCQQIIASLQGIDSKLLEAAVSRMEVGKRNPIRKTMIEHEQLQRQGKNVIT